MTSLNAAPTGALTRACKALQTGIHSVPLARHGFAAEMVLSKESTSIGALSRRFALFASRKLIRAGALVLPTEALLLGLGLSTVAPCERVLAGLPDLTRSVPLPVTTVLLGLSPAGTD